MGGYDDYTVMGTAPKAKTPLSLAALIEVLERADGDFDTERLRGSTDPIETLVFILGIESREQYAIPVLREIATLRAALVEIMNRDYHGHSCPDVARAALATAKEVRGDA